MQDGNQRKIIRLIGDIFIFALGNLGVKLFQFILLPLYTSVLTTDAYGAAELVNGLSDLICPIVTICIYEAVFRFSISKKYDNKMLISTALIITSIMLTLFVLISCIFNIGFRYQYMPYLCFIVITYSLRTLFAFYARGNGKVSVFAFSGVINSIALVGCNLLLLLRYNLGTRGYLLSLGLSHTITAIYLFFVLKLYKKIQVRSYNSGVLKEILKYSFPLVFFNVTLWSNTLIGRYILSVLGSESEVGMYVAASKVVAIINMLQQIFYFAFQLNIAREYEDESENVSCFLSNTFKAYSAILLLFGSIAISSSGIVSFIVLKGDFYMAKIYLPLAMFGALVDCVFCFFKSLYSSYMKTGRLLISSSVAAVANIALCYMLIPKYRIWGVFLAYAVSNLVAAIIRVIDTEKFIHIDKAWKNNLLVFGLILVQVIIIKRYEGECGYIYGTGITLIILLIESWNYRSDIKRMISYGKRYLDSMKKS